MTDGDDRIRIVIQKLTEAIWNLDQIQPLEGNLKVEYERIQTARENLIRLVRKDNTG